MSSVLPAAPSACPDENVLAGFARGALSAERLVALEAHLDGCADCRALVAVVAEEASVPVPGGAEAPTCLDTGLPTEPRAGALSVLPEGARLGPYVLRGLLGAGGMGVVYAAEDPRLGRRVALKLLHPRATGPEARARLLREAQAMARLSHPNVLPVFERGSAEGHDFLALELVEGPTLARWLAERERPWREVLAMFLAAGEGLAAAHRAGLVHRDFKPSNVLVGPDRRPRVTDFGLVRQGPAAPEAGTLEPPGPSDLALTRAGAAPGTPAYMAPEQREGHPVDARGDQYSFCVALQEALSGLRPGASGAPGLAPSRRHAWAPRHVRTALARGLSPRPEDRFARMEDLLAALSQPPPWRRWPWALAAVAALALSGLMLHATTRDVPGTAPTGPGAARGNSSGSESDPLSSEGALLSLRVGELRELTIPGLRRVAVGEPGTVDVRTRGVDVLRLEPLQPGATHVLVWTGDGARRLYTVSVRGQ